MFRKPDNKAPLPSWLKWMLALFVLYAGLSSLRSGDDIQTLIHNPDAAKPSPIQETVSGLKHKWRDVKGLEWRDVRTASGPKAVCGQRVTAHYTLFSAAGQKIKDTRADGGTPVEFVIGHKTVIPALEQVVEGMVVGGTREFSAPSYLGFDAPGFADPAVAQQTALSGSVELLAVAPSLPQSDFALRVWDAGVTGKAPVLTCGQAADVALTIWNHKGEPVFPPSGDAGEMPVTPGSGTLPYWLEQGLIGAPIGGLRTLLVPPAFQGVTLGQGGDAAKRLDFGRQGLMLVDVRVKGLRPAAPAQQSVKPTEKE